MKKVLLSVLATVSLIMIVPATTLAASSVSDVTGVVTNAGSGVKGAKVTVVCDGNTGHDTTNSTGSYRVQFGAKKCPVGSSVTVSATTKSGLSGTGNGTVNSDGSTKLNVAIVDVTVGLPEMGAVTGAAAVAAAGGALLVTRRRSLAKE